MMNLIYEEEWDCMNIIAQVNGNNLCKYILAASL